MAALRPKDMLKFEFSQKLPSAPTSRAILDQRARQLEKSVCSGVRVASALVSMHAYMCVLPAYDVP